ncbi:hypothetical protein A0H76_2480 [Hepatospora eriocheir]|uniref:Uncharacterized protein n=1 Tax=Hepatospora eriocheir TaxID=1081669 RepID=A0A1X0QJU7_9MICR|nr:hypothetical protein A0H76_2480 [Hepatospora eriocheir]
MRFFTLLIKLILSSESNRRSNDPNSNANTGRFIEDERAGHLNPFKEISVYVLIIGTGLCYPFAKGLLYIIEKITGEKYLVF